MRKKPGILSNLVKIMILIMIAVCAYVIISSTMNMQNLEKAKILIEEKQYSKAQKLLEKPTILRNYKQKESLLEVYHYEKKDEKIKKLIQKETYLKNKFRTKEILLNMYLRQEDAQGIKKIVEDIKSSDNLNKDMVLHRYESQISQLLNRDQQERELESSKTDKVAQVNLDNGEKISIVHSSEDKYYVLREKQGKKKFIGQIPTQIKKYYQADAHSQNDAVVVLLTGKDEEGEKIDNLFVIKNNVISTMTVKSDIVHEKNPQTDEITITALNGEKKFIVDNRYIVAKQGPSEIKTSLYKEGDKVYIKRVSKATNKDNTVTQITTYSVDTENNIAYLSDYDLKTKFLGKLYNKDEKQRYTIKDACGKWITDDLSEETNGLVLNKTGFKVAKIGPSGNVIRYQGYSVNRENTKVEQISDNIIMMTGKAMLSRGSSSSCSFSLKIEFVDTNNIKVSLQGDKIEPQPEINYRRI